MLLDELQDAGQLDWTRAVIDSSHMRAKGGAGHTGPSPVDRSRPGSKHHLIVDGSGIPLAVILTAANRNDITQLLALIDRVPPVGGHGKLRPRWVYTDRAYDSAKHLKELRARGSLPRSPNARLPTALASAATAG